MSRKTTVNATRSRTTPSDLTAFFAWTACAAADRAGHDYSYTNN